MTEGVAALRHERASPEFRVNSHDNFSRSNSPSRAATTMVATPLPQMLVSARHSLMNLSTPSSSAMPVHLARPRSASLAGRAWFLGCLRHDPARTIRIKRRVRRSQACAIR